MASGSALTAYQKAILDARRRGFFLTRQSQQAIELALREAARAIEFDIATTTNPMTILRGTSMREQILAVLEELTQKVTNVVGATQRLTISDVLAIHDRVVSTLLRQAGIEERSLQFDRLNIRVTSVLTARRENAATFATLVRRNVREAAPALDRLINQSVLRGVPTRRLATDIADLLANAEGADLSTYGLNDSAVTGLRTLHYDARRIAVSETLNALRESQAQALDGSPIVRAIRWQTSGNHGIADECDILEQEDFYGLGPGFYPPEHWPLAPHPFCACTQGEVDMRPVEEWGSPRPPSPAAAVDWESFTPAVSVAGDWSEARMERATATLRAALADPIGWRVRRVA